MDRIPVGAMYRLDGNTLVDNNGGDTAYGRDLARWRESAREEATRTARLNVELDHVGKYISYIQGQHWDPRRPRYKSRFVDNRVGKTRFDVLSLLTNPRPTIDVGTKVAEYQDTADAIEGVIRHEWLHNDMDLSLVTAADICMAYGTSFWKQGACKPGLMKVSPCGPDQVMPIQPGMHIQESSAVLYKTYKPVHWARSRFPFRAADIERESAAIDIKTAGGNSSYARPGHIEEYVWQGLSPQMRRIVGVRQEPISMGQDYFKSLEIQEYYVDDPSVNESKETVVMRDPYLALDAHNWWYKVKPGDRLYPRKRLLIFAGRRVLYDGPSPFIHGLYPFSMLRLNPVFYSFWGLSKYRDLIPLNMAINEIVAGGLDMIKRTLNPQAITKENAVSGAAWREFFSDMPGAKLRLQNNADPSRDFKYLDSPKISADVFTMLQGWLDPEYQKMAGMFDTAAMMGKGQVPGGDTIEQMRDSQQTGTQLEGRFLEAFIRDAGVQAVPNVLQFYTASRTMQILGKAGLVLQHGDDAPGVFTPAGVDPSDFCKTFEMSIEPGSLRSNARDRDKQISIALATAGLISIKELYRRLEIVNADQIMGELKEQAAANIQPGGGSRTSRGQRNGQAA